MDVSGQEQAATSTPPERQMRGSLLKCHVSGKDPVSLMEFTIEKDANEKDFYDVSLKDGYNVGLWVKAVGGAGHCKDAGCVADLNRHCQTELQVTEAGSVEACKNACTAFKQSQFCCTENHSTPETCPPTQYSKLFKAACPTAYSYAYDDPSSTRTCAGSDYLITSTRSCYVIY